MDTYEYITQGGPEKLREALETANEEIFIPRKPRRRNQLHCPHCNVWFPRNELWLGKRCPFCKEKYGTEEND